jgi:hypothetical protein
VANRRVVERYTAAIADDDFDSQTALVHDDYVLEFPQSGERFVGREARRAVFERYPGREGSGNRPAISSISGTDDQFVTRPSWPAFSIVHLSGSGDEFSVTGIVRYPNDDLWHFVSLITTLDGAIWRETVYWGQPFDPPEWRRGLGDGSPGAAPPSLGS